MILPIFDNLVVEKTKWRILESFLTNMGESMWLLNPLEIQDLFLPKVLTCLKNSNQQIKLACARFISTLIHYQYVTDKRLRVIEIMQTEFALSPSFTHRKSFIIVCTEVVSKISFGIFMEHFFDSYLLMAQDKVTDVKIQFLNSVCSVRPYLELLPNCLNQFNVALSGMLNDQSQFIYEMTG